jgi:hypothetical protein
VREHGKLRAHSRLRLEIEFCHHHTLAVRQSRLYDTPMINDHRITPGLTTIGVQPRLAGRHHESQILDRTGA